MARPYPYDILLAGIGPGGEQNTTIGTVRALKQARIVYSLSVHGAYICRICREFVDLTESYFTGEKDERVYERLARRVVSEARRRPGVALVDDGHPLLYDDVCHKIASRGQRLGLRVKVLPAVSSIDAMLVDCGLRLDAAGTQIVEATTLVLRKQRLNPALETLVLQVGWFGTCLLSEIEAQKPERFAPLQEYLLRFFPPDHRVWILRAPLTGGERPVRMSCALRRLCLSCRNIDTDSTLHIPALDRPAALDRGLLGQLTDRKHLCRIARLANNGRAPRARRS